MENKALWYQSFESYSKENPAIASDVAVLHAALPESERADSLWLLEIHADQPNATGSCLPKYFFIPDELMQPWQYSANGGILGNQQDFGYFSPAEAVSFYLIYQFWHYAPNLMPIALNGGGVFYCYDFRQPDFPLQIAMGFSGNLGGSSDELVPVGNMLAEILAKEIMSDWV